MFDLFAISVTSFSSAFKLVCERNGLDEEAALWLLFFFMKRPAAARLDARVALRSKSHRRHKEGKVMTYCDALNYLVEAYATDDVVVQTDTDIMRFSQPSIKFPTENEELLLNDALRGHRVYDE